jgi:hypothetical protein
MITFNHVVQSHRSKFWLVYMVEHGPNWHWHLHYASTSCKLAMIDGWFTSQCFTMSKSTWSYLHHWWPCLTSINMNFDIGTPMFYLCEPIVGWLEYTIPLSTLWTQSLTHLAFLASTYIYMYPTSCNSFMWIADGHSFFEFIKYTSKNIESHLLVVSKNNNLINFIIVLCLFWKSKYN